MYLCLHMHKIYSLVAQRLKRLPLMQETWVLSLGREDTLEKVPTPVFLGFPLAQLIKNSPAMWVTWRAPGEGKGYPLQYSGLENSMDCMGSQRVGHD